jgi:hypothetical protein
MQQKDRGKSVLTSLSERKTTRSISSKELPEQVLSNLLCSAFGVNRNVADMVRYNLGPSQPDHTIGDPEIQKSYYYTDTGFIAQNVYLFAASFGLAVWFHNCNKGNIVSEFKLIPTQKVLFAQTIGYPE